MEYIRPKAIRDYLSILNYCQILKFIKYETNNFSFFSY